MEKFRVSFDFIRHGEAVSINSAEVPEGWDLEDITAGFWVDGGGRMSPGESRRYFIMPHHIRSIRLAKY